MVLLGPSSFAGAILHRKACTPSYFAPIRQLPRRLASPRPVLFRADRPRIIPLHSISCSAIHDGDGDKAAGVDPAVAAALEALPYDQLSKLKKLFKLTGIGRKKVDLVEALCRVADEKGLDALLGALEPGGGSSDVEASSMDSDGEVDQDFNEPLEPSLLSVFQAMAAKDITKLCKELGMPYQAKKQALVEDLTRMAMQQGLETVLGQAASVALGASEEGSGFASQEPAVPDDSGTDDTQMDPFLIKAELRNMSRGELVDVLMSKGADVEGSDDELVDRLAAIIADEVESELQSMPEEQVGDEAARGPISQEQMEQLVARLSSQMHSFFMSNTRPALYSELKSMGIEAPYSTKTELAAKIAEFKAWQEVQAMVQAAATDASVAKELWDQLDLISAEAAVTEAAAASGEKTEPSGEEEVDLNSIQTLKDLVRIPSHQILNLKIRELRELLERLGQNAEGNKYVMRERVIELHEKLCAAGLSQSGAAQNLNVQAMPLRDLRAQLATWNLSTSGPRQQLEERLLEALSKMAPDSEVGDEDAAGDAEDYSLAEGPSAYLDDTLDLRPTSGDPNLTLAVLCGAPMGTHAMAEASLHAARTIADLLYTAPLPTLGLMRGGQEYMDAIKERQKALDALSAEVQVALDEAMEVSAGGEAETSAEADAPTSGEEEEDWRLSATGMTVQVYYIDSTMRVHVLSPQELVTTTASLLEAGHGDHTILPNYGALLAHLKEGEQQLVLPAMFNTSSLGSQQAKVMAELHEAFSKSASCHLLATSKPAAAAQVNDRWKCKSMLDKLGYPTVPAFHVDTNRSWQQELQAWCAALSLDHEYGHFLVKPVMGGDGGAVIPVRGLSGAQAAVAQLDSSAGGLLVEPYLGHKAIQFSCTVVQAPGGEPLALMPSEIEVYDVERKIFEAEVDSAEWDMMRMGMSAEAVTREVEKLRSAAVPHEQYGIFVPGRKYLPTQTVKYHCPPRLSRKMVHHIRHAAAKLFSQMELQGTARVDGWVLPDPDWVRMYEPKDSDITVLLDSDPNIVAQKLDQDALAAQRDPTPLKDYYDTLTWHYADLDAFDPARRLNADSNGEATVLIGDVNVNVMAGVDLAPGSLPLHQASELGVSPEALLRFVVASGLEAVSPCGAALLCPPRQTDAWSSALLNHFAPEVWDLQTMLCQDMVDTRMLVEIEEKERQGRADEVGQLADVLLDMIPEAVQLYHPAGEKAVNEVASILDTELDATEEGSLEEVAEEAEGDEADLDAYLAESELQAVKKHLLEGIDGVEVEEEEEPSTKDKSQGPGDVEDVLFDANELEVDLYDQFEANAGEWDATWSGKRSEEEYADIGALREAHPDLADEELMFLALGVTADGVTINPEAFVEWCRAKRAANAAGTPLDIYAAATVEYTDAAYEEYDQADDVDVESLAGLADDASEAVAAAVVEGEGEEVEESPDELAALELLPSMAVDADLPSRPHRVWVLMGGSPGMSNASLVSGLNVMRKLKQYSDVQVDAFLMVTAGAGQDEERRREALLKRRNELLSLGTSQADLPASMQLELRNMPHIETVAEVEYIWALPEALVYYHDAAAVLDACERSNRLHRTSYHALDPVDQMAVQVRQDVQAELAAGGFEGIGGLWGADPNTLPIPPRLLSLSQFATEAEDREATVFISMHDGPAADGMVQQWLDAFGVSYTGSKAVANRQLQDKILLPSLISQLYEFGIATIPNRMMVPGMLEDMALSEDYAASVFNILRMELAVEGGPAEGKLHVKPSMMGGGLGCVRIDSPSDLMLFSQAAVSGTPLIPANALSYPHPAIPMPRTMPPFYMVEPYIASDPVRIQSDPDMGGSSRSSAVVNPDTNWLEVSIGLLGREAEVQAMGVSVRVSGAGGDAQATSEVQYLTPTPLSIASLSTQADAASRAESLASILGVSGIARLDAFMHRETGELIVIELEVLPDLGADSVLYQQAMHPRDGGIPMYPKELLRVVVGIAMEDASSSDAFGEGEESDDVEGAESDMDMSYDLTSLAVGGRGGGEDEFYSMGAASSRAAADDEGLEDGMSEQLGDWRFSPQGSAEDYYPK